PKTLATAIRIGNPASWKEAEEARDQSGGLIYAVSDKEILAAYKMLAFYEGVFVEPASAASVAGLLRIGKSGYFKGKIKNAKEKIKIVCILTGHGLKDPDRAIKSVSRPKVIKAGFKEVIRELGY
ncbi:MAG: pyridoxal-phosphate dependent enzyme, partial [Candidatus Omnitrophica bacterium]|nr:pyridoxal-phosphate dependent enzyme [Candidatus Omnitrophota bacterium]